MPNDQRDRSPSESEPGSTLGLPLFGIYVLLYGGFMALVLFRPAWLSTRPLGGVNLAIAYGMTLIGGALVLAVIYMIARRDRPARP
jgi:uncharacterized membrane protein (DUF485 family)